MDIRVLILSALALGCTETKSDPPQRSNAEVVSAYFAATAAGDQEAVEALTGDDYIQHPAQTADGSGMTHRTLVDEDRVAVHQTYTLTDGTSVVAWDIFRLKNGKLAEHWGAMQAEVPADQTVSGRSMTDGPTAITDEEATEANRSLVTEFVDVVLTQGQFDRLAEFISLDQYDQHNPGIADGLEGLGALAASLQEANLTFYYTRSPLVVAQGNFVMVASEGVFGPADAPPLAMFFDLWRVEDGKIVEHWDVVPADPDPLALKVGRSLTAD